MGVCGQWPVEEGSAWAPLRSAGRRGGVYIYVRGIERRLARALAARKVPGSYKGAISRFQRENDGTSNGISYAQRTDLSKVFSLGPILFPPS